VGIKGHDTQSYSLLLAQLVVSFGERLRGSTPLPMQETYSRTGIRVIPAESVRSGVFLDRDGVIVEDTGYLHRVEDIRYIPGSLEAIARLNIARIPVIMVTNQAGIGRGYFGWPEFEAVQQRIEEDLAREGAWLDGVWACARHPNGSSPLAQADHPWRKPNPGMILDAASRLAIDLRSSWMVGDKLLDIEAACRAGLRGAVHVLTGYGQETRPEVARLEAALRARCAIRYATALSQAVSILIEDFAVA